MTKDQRPKRILLAVDLLAEEPKLIRRVWEALTPITQGADVYIEPVAVLTPADYSIGKVLANRIGGFRGAAERHLTETLKGLGLSGLAKAKILYAEGPSNRQAVKALLTYAKKKHCDLIAVSSHSRKGLSRLFLGSFAETLTLQSPIPLLIVNPRHRRSDARIKTILFPTDFSATSKETLDALCQAFEGTKPKIVIFHGCGLPPQVYIEPYGSFPNLQPMFDEEIQRGRKRGIVWRDYVRSLGMRCEIVLDRKSLFIAESILDAAERCKADVIALSTTGSKVGTTLLGSIARQVLRNAPQAVWIFHPERTDEARPEAGSGRQPKARKPKGDATAVNGPRPANLSRLLPS